MLVVKPTTTDGERWWAVVKDTGELVDAFETEYEAQKFARIANMLSDPGNIAGWKRRSRRKEPKNILQKGRVV